VQTAIVTALRTRYCFANRSFGQGVTGDEIAALIQALPGVVGVNVTALTPGKTSKAGDLASGGWSVYAYHQWLAQTVPVTRPDSGGQARICPLIQATGTSAPPTAAEILVLDPDPNAISLGALP
jgi:hypothetical protein